MKTIGLVSCTKTKRLNPSPAKDLYMPSALFSKARAYSESAYDEWYVLSAEHGLLHPETIVEPYDVTLNNMGIAARREWGRRVWKDLRTLLPCVIFFHAGIRYRETIVPILREFNITFHTPLEGLRFGEQMAWYEEQLRRSQDVR